MSSWPPPNLLGYIDKLRRLIAADRKRYSEFKAYLYPTYPDLWEPVGEMLKARARFFRGEIIRAKHDTQRFALGEDPPQPTKFGQMVCDWGTKYIYELPEEIQSLNDSWEYLQQQKITDNFHVEIADIIWRIDEWLLENCREGIKGVTKDLERITYG